jgi:sulfopyruvate decarboxylase TPP-binding subunit
MKRLGFGMAIAGPDSWLAQRYQFPLLMLVSYRGTPEDPVFYHIPKGRATEPVLKGLGVGRFMAAIGAPRYVPTMFGGGRLESG